MHTPGVVVTCGVMGGDTAWYVDINGGGLNDENIVVCISVGVTCDVMEVLLVDTVGHVGGGGHNDESVGVCTAVRRIDNICTKQLLWSLSHTGIYCPSDVYGGVYHCSSHTWFLEVW